jgi:hypothetical protein
VIAVTLRSGAGEEERAKQQASKVEQEAETFISVISRENLFGKDVTADFENWR